MTTRLPIAVVLLAISLVLGACVAPQTTAIGGPVAAVQAGSPAPVAAARAAQLFEAVCGDTLPNFANAKARMQAIGVTVPSPTGTPTIYSQTEDLSFQIIEGPGLGRTCSMVFGSQDTEGTIQTALSRFGAFQPTDLGAATVYKGRAALVIFSGEVKRLGSTRYYNVRLLSER